jgi:N-hydroxyarylamine O-acetyltransferase
MHLFTRMETEGYLKRLDDDGPLQATADTLRRLHLAHLRHIPFENLDIHLGNPILLDTDALYDKIVRRRRGGFCYELNGLFAELLRALGFRVTLLSARVAEDGAFSPEFDHLTLRVNAPPAAGLPPLPWLADVGFGDSFLLPLRLDTPDAEQREGSHAYRVTEKGADLTLWRRKSNEPWAAQYRFTLAPRRLAQYTARCRYHQTSPQSHFTQKQVCTRVTENGRITLSDRRLIITENELRREEIVNEDQARTILRERFAIQLDDFAAPRENYDQ